MIFTYTPDILRPDCATCGRSVQQTEGDPEQPWEGTCPAGHVHTYQLEDEEDEPCSD